MLRERDANKEAYAVKEESSSELSSGEEELLEKHAKGMTDAQKRDPAL